MSNEANPPVLLQIYDWVGRGRTSYAYQAFTTGDKPVPYVVKVLRESAEDERDVLINEADILRRLSGADWVCKVYAYLEGADPECRSALLIKYGGEALESWKELSHEERCVFTFIFSCL